MLGDLWLERFLASPIWCFSASGGCAGDHSFAGVLMPSLDRIGRYYPLSIVALISTEESAAEIAAGAVQWFARLEAAALSCLADNFDFEAFDSALASEPLPTARGGATAHPAGLAPPAAAMPRLLGCLLEQNAVPYSLWWTSGSPTVAAGCRAFQGLPPQEEFHKLLA
jgi:type VI secretion system protein ImpM